MNELIRFFWFRASDRKLLDVLLHSFSSRWKVQWRSNRSATKYCGKSIGWKLSFTIHWVVSNEMRPNRTVRSNDKLYLSPMIASLRAAKASPIAWESHSIRATYWLPPSKSLKRWFTASMALQNLANLLITSATSIKTLSLLEFLIRKRRRTIKIKI